MSKTTGRAADAYWTQIDGTEVGTSEFGNTHIGFLYAYEQSSNYVDVFVYIDDFDCEEGEVPFFGHGFEDVEGPIGEVVVVEEPPVDEEPPFEEESGCDYIGSRFGHGEDMVFELDKKLNTGRLTGTLVVLAGGFHGEGGGVVGRPAVDITWTGISDLGKSRSTYRYTEDGVTYSYTDRSSHRQASIDGYIGGMSFDPELSGGYLTQFKNSSRERIK